MDMLIAVKDGKATVLSNVQTSAGAPPSISIDGKLTEINPATGQPLNPVPGYVSDLATLLTGKQSVDAGKENPTQSNATGGQETQRLPYINGKHYDLAPGPYILQGARGEVALHVKAEKAGSYRVSLAGTLSGEVTGGASMAVGDRSATEPKKNIMDGQLYSYGYVVDLKAGEYLNQFLRIDGGDQDVHFRVIG